MGLWLGGLFLSPFGSEGLLGAGSKKLEEESTPLSIRLH